MCFHSSHLGQNPSCMPQVLKKNCLHFTPDCCSISTLGYSASHQVNPVGKWDWSGPWSPSQKQGLCSLGSPRAPLPAALLPCQPSIPPGLTSPYHLALMLRPQTLLCQLKAKPFPTALLSVKSLTQPLLYFQPLLSSGPSPQPINMLKSHLLEISLTLTLLEDSMLLVSTCICYLAS